MPAFASTPIRAATGDVAGLGVSDLVEATSLLREALTQVADPRARRRVRHQLAGMLSAAVCAVAAGARSFVTIAE